MMIGRVVITGVPDGDEHVRGPASPSNQRSSQRCRNLGAAPPTPGPGAPNGQDESPAYTDRQGVPGSPAAPPRARGAAPDAAAGAPGHGAPLAPRPHPASAPAPTKPKRQGPAPPGEFPIRRGEPHPHP